VRSVSENRRFSVQIGEASSGKLALISNDGLQQYRCLMAELNPDNPVLSEEQAKALQLNEGDGMRVLWLGNI